MAAKSSTPQVSSKEEAKAELKKLKEQRKRDKAEAKARKKAKKKSGSGDGFFSRIKQVFNMTRTYDPNIGWWMALAALVAFTVTFVLFTVLLNWITGLLVALPSALLGAMIVMNRRAQKAAFHRIEGRPGAAVAALNTLRRGWIITEEPVAMDPKTQDSVFRVIGKPGVILITEGPPNRVKKLASRTQKRLSPILKNTGVPVHVVHVGRAEGQVPLPQLTKHIKKLDKSLTKHEVHAVEQRLSALPAVRPPIPKGVDPYRVRPDRKALRG